jgi:hypothetical protein
MLDQPVKLELPRAGEDSNATVSRTHRNRTARAGFRPVLVVAACVLAGCGADRSPTPDAQGANPDDWGWGSGGAESGSGPAAVTPFQGQTLAPTVLDGLVLQVLAEGHLQPDGMERLPAMEQDLVYLLARLQTEDGRPVQGAPVRLTTPSGNPVLLEGQETDAFGYVAFTLFMAEPGVASFTVTALGLQKRFEVDAMRLEASPWLRGIQGPGITPWSTLRGARVEFVGEGFTGSIRNEFGPEVEALAGQRIRLAGYMIPLAPEARQEEFLLGASPPGCFFHPPGGPTTLVLVESDPRAPVPLTEEALVVEGRLELIRESDYALVYRLVAARVP